MRKCMHVCLSACVCLCVYVKIYAFTESQRKNEEILNLVSCGGVICGGIKNLTGLFKHLYRIVVDVV